MGARAFRKSFTGTVASCHGRFDFGELEVELSDCMYKKVKSDIQRNRVFCIMTCIVVMILILALCLLSGKLTEAARRYRRGCDDCRISIRESFPEGMVYTNSSEIFESTFEAWSFLLDEAKTEVMLATFYWTLLDEDTNTSSSSSYQGRIIFEKLLNLTSRGVNLKIVQNMPKDGLLNSELVQLIASKYVELRLLDFNQLMGSGVLHTKLWIVDERYAYLGSANMDWRSLTQVYWELGVPGAQVPSVWPSELSTKFNKDNPMRIKINGNKASSYFSSSPSAFCPSGRTVDVASILSVILKADRFVYISVMDYYPISLFTKKTEWWPDLDNAIRKAAVENKVVIRLMCSVWNSTRHSMLHFLRSLLALNNSLSRKLFVVPPSQNETIPYTRVNHAKFMVTDKAAYVGTSNWSKDYFTSTAGASIVIEEKEGIRRDLEKLFMRDWNSTYATFLTSSK